MTAMNTRDTLFRNIIRTYEKLSAVHGRFRCAHERSAQMDYAEFKGLLDEAYRAFDYARGISHLIADYREWYTIEQAFVELPDAYAKLFRAIESLSAFLKNALETTVDEHALFNLRLALLAASEAYTESEFAQKLTLEIALHKFAVFKLNRFKRDFFEQS